MAAAVVVVKPGPLMTVQDLGRPGWGRFGVSPSGAMDPLAARAANALAGNPAGAALLEITGAGGEIQLEEGRRVGLAGADLGAEIAGAGGGALAPWCAADVAAGQRLRFGQRRRGARAYLAVAGGLRAEAVLGSAATDLAAGLGGVGGRPLRAGDRLPFGPAPAAAPERSPADLGALARFYLEPDRLRFVAAPGAPATALEAFAAARYAVSARSNRVGFQLDGPGLPWAVPADLLSEPIAPGAIQVLPDGRPILLMADRQTVGGYPVIGFLARADVPKAAQLWPLDQVRFAAVSVEEAQEAARAQDVAVAALAAAAAPRG